MQQTFISPVREQLMTPVLDVSQPSSARLDEIATQWSLFYKAHQSALDTPSPARNTFALRYRSAIRKYVGAIVKDAQEADELTQEVLVRMLRGDFAGANPQRGRFRDLLKVAVRNLVRTHWSRKQRRSTVILEEASLSDSNSEMRAGRDAMMAAWRQSILDNAMAALEAHQHAHPGTVQATLLRLRMEHPELDSEELAARLAECSGKAIRVDCLRQQLHRARACFAQLLVKEVARSLVHPTAQRIDEELRETGLIQYVRDYLGDDWPELAPGKS
jgi:RNA polymerase sigma factor (sigma-70 family)